MFTLVFTWLLCTTVLLVIHSFHIFAIATSCILLALVVYLVLLSLLSDPFQLFAFISTPSLVLRTLALHSIRGHQTFAFLRRIGSCLLLLNWIPSECSAYLAWFCLHMFCNQCRYQRIKFFTPNVSSWSCYRRSDSCSELTLWFRYLFQTMKLTSNSLFAPKTCTC